MAEMKCVGCHKERHVWAVSLQGESGGHLHVCCACAKALAKAVLAWIAKAEAQAALQGVLEEEDESDAPS